MKKILFLKSKRAFFYLQASRKDVQATWFQPSKENIQHLKKWNILFFSIFVGHFCPPGSGSESSWTKSMRSYCGPIRIGIRIHNTAYNTSESQNFVSFIAEIFFNTHVQRVHEMFCCCLVLQWTSVVFKNAVVPVVKPWLGWIILYCVTKRYLKFLFFNCRVSWRACHCGWSCTPPSPRTPGSTPFWARPAPPLSTFSRFANLYSLGTVPYPCFHALLGQVDHSRPLQGLKILYSLGPMHPHPSRPGRPLRTSSRFANLYSLGTFASIPFSSSILIVVTSIGTGVVVLAHWLSRC